MAATFPPLTLLEHPIVAGLSWDAVTRFGGYNKVEAAEGMKTSLTLQRHAPNYRGHLW